jgi:alpha-tubulin suppressor-like RCC1 family protein
MIKDILLQVSRSYTTQSISTDIYVSGDGRYGNFDADTLQYTFNEVVPNTTWIDVDYMRDFTVPAGFAVKSDNTLWRWGTGNSTNPILGPSIAILSPTQLTTSATTNDWSKVFCGDRNVFAIKTNNTLWGWGSNNSYMLGLGDLTRRSSPVQIGGTSDWKWVSSDTETTLAVKTNGTLWSWGTAYYGTNGRNKSILFPSKLFTDKQFKKISTGDQHTLAIDNSNNLWAWGANTIGKLGNNSVGTVSSPVQISAGTTWKHISANRSTTMGITTDGKLYGWGEGAGFRMGSGTTTDRSTPFQIGTDTNWMDVSAGIDHGLGLKEVTTGSGSLWSWGQNATGGLGLNDTNQRSVPTQIGTDSDWKKVYAGLSFSVALKHDNTLWTWGVNNSGQLGDRTISSRSSPTQIGTAEWKDISVGQESTIAIKDDGTVWGWGLNSYGELGQGNTTPRSSPIQIGTGLLTAVDTIALGQYVGCAIQGTDIFFWGFVGGYHIPVNNIPTGTYTQPYIWNTTISSPVISFVSASFGGVYSGNASFLDSDGYIYMPSSNPTVNTIFGITDQSSPVQIGTDTDWDIVKVQGRGVAVGLKTNGTLWYWGTTGAEIFGSYGSNASPVQLGSSTDWKDFSIGGNMSDTAGTPGYGNTTHMVAVKNNGTIWAWGLNSNGQFGNNSTIANQTSSPVQIGSGTTWVSSSCAGINQSFFIKSDGTLWGSGQNLIHRLGLGDTTARSSLTQISTQNSWASSYKKVASNGLSAVLALTTDGKMLLTSGDSASDQGNPQYPAIPTRQFKSALSGLRGVKSISAGTKNLMFVKSDSSLWGFGQNKTATNLLLTGDTNKGYISPIQIGTTSDWKSISLGSPVSSTDFEFVLGVKDDGTLWAWGNNTYGQLGDSSSITKTSPVQIGSGTDWSSSMAHVYHGSAIKNNGDVYIWGNNNFGQLGDSTAISKNSPIQLTNFSKISIENHSLGIKSDGTLWSWGYNSNGQLGLGDTVSRSSPIQIGSGTNWKDIRAGTLNSHAIKTDGTLWAWGNWDISQTPFGYDTSIWSPKFYQPTNITFIEAGNPTTSGLASLNATVHINAIDSSGILWAWGVNAVGQIGDGTNTTVLYPKKVITDKSWTMVSAGASHTIGLRTDNKLWGWGQNSSGQLGQVTNIIAVSSPVQIASDKTWSKVSCRNADHALGITSSGTLWAWGLGTSGQLGNNASTSRSSAVQVGIDTNWDKVYSGGAHSFAIKTTGTLWAWGNGGTGRLGLNSTTSFSTPQQVLVGKSFIMIGAGSSHTLAIDSNNKLWAWGLGTNGQLGDGTITTKSSPVQIGNDNWTDISAARTHSVGIRSNGTLWVWGSSNTANDFALGLGSESTISSPVQIGTDTDWSKVTACFDKCFAVKTNGDVYASGRPNGGSFYNQQFFGDFSSPVQVGTLTNWSKISNKGFYFPQGEGIYAAIKTDGTLWAWGNNAGTLAINPSTAADISSPVQIGTGTSWANVETTELGIVAIQEQIL